ATNCRLVGAEEMTQQPATVARPVDESETWRPVVAIRRDARHDARRERQVQPPEGLLRVAFARGGDVIEQIDRLPRVLVPHSEVECQVRANPPVVLKEVVLVELIVGEIGRAKAHGERLETVIDQLLYRAGRVCAIDVRQEWHGVIEPAEIDPALELVIAPRVAEDVSVLIGLDQTALWEIGRRADVEQRAATDGNAAEVQVCE